MTKVAQECVKLYNGVQMPLLGFGVWRIENGSATSQAVRWALKTGYRHIDTACIYENEESVGQAIRESGVPREELWVTTKLWNTDQGYDSALAAFERSRKLLGLEYIDLYLIHWPKKSHFAETWRALEKLYEEKKVRAIGVSNFESHHITKLFQTCKIRPMVNQVELHTQFQQRALLKFCKQHDIVVTAWSPLGGWSKNNLLENPVLCEIGRKYKKSAAQVVIRWDIQSGIVVIPKSSNKNRIEENFDVWDFQLTEEDMCRIAELDQDKRIGFHPEHFYND